MFDSFNRLNMSHYGYMILICSNMFDMIRLSLNLYECSYVGPWECTEGFDSAISGRQSKFLKIPVWWVNRTNLRGKILKGYFMAIEVGCEMPWI